MRTNHITRGSLGCVCFLSYRKSVMEQGALVINFVLIKLLGVTAIVWATWTGKPAPIEVMKQLTKEDIKPMYKCKYWDAVQGDHLPSGVDISVADFGVNAGPSRAAKRLQRVVMATQDGKIGPKTLSMVFNMEPAALLDKYAEARESYYRSLKTFEIYGRGWLRRNDEVLEKAKSMIS